MLNIGLLHPGTTGVALIKDIGNNHMLYWASEGRSNKTRKQAHDAGLHDTHTITNLTKICDLIISVLPPDIALEVASSVIKNRFDGVYLEANPMLPQQSISLAKEFESLGATYIDASLIHQRSATPGFLLSLCGTQTKIIEDLFQGSSAFSCNVVSEKIGDASMLKLLDSALNKTHGALLVEIIALAEQHHLSENFEHILSMGDTQRLEFVKQRISSVASKAWRFSSEMEILKEQTVDLNVSKHFEAALNLYKSLDCFKDKTVTSEEVLAELTKKKNQ